MQVYKFGGASVKDARGVKRLAEIVDKQAKPIIVVVSAMGKMTDALEQIVDAYWHHNRDYRSMLQKIKDYHLHIVSQLFEAGHQVYDDLKVWFGKLEQALSRHPSMNYDFEYDRIVSFGEMISTTIVAHYLNSVGIKTQWLDVRDFVKTDSRYRDAKVDWDMTLYKIKSFDFSKPLVYLTQGFIGSDRNNLTTTLGREGSDFTGAIFAWCLNAKSLTVWKDVDGIYNADPKIFADARKFEKLSYSEAIELSFYGAKVIHPKTIKPLYDKAIPLYVRTFLEPVSTGTIISLYSEGMYPRQPVIIQKNNQVLISVSQKDFGFIVESVIQRIFSAIERYRLKVNVMQRSALKFSIALDNDKMRVASLLGDLRRDFEVKFNTGLTLYTFRHYDEETIKKVTAGKKVFLHQQSRVMSFYLVSD